MQYFIMAFLKDIARWLDEERKESVCRVLLKKTEERGHIEHDAEGDPLKKIFKVKRKEVELSVKCVVYLCEQKSGVFIWINMVWEFKDGGALD